jgi:hypothetical protein
MQWKYYALVYEDGKTRLETIPGMGGSKGE